MSSEVFPLQARLFFAQQALAARFMFALSRGDPAWDSRWTGVNPPTPDLSVTNVLSLIGYARASVQDYLKPDDNGTIVTGSGAKFSVSETRTRFIRVRLALPTGSFAGETVREIGLYVNPTIDASVPPGQILIPNSAVQDKGDCFQMHWRPPVPIETGDTFNRNFVMRI